jgi:hypothetical protein
MDISSIASNLEANQMEALYAVKILKMAQESEFAVTSELLEDVVEISKEAMEMFKSERV